ncbi:MAG: metal-sensing transcriptional repressor [Lachnospiraceae bacterium]|nr:metal-sensing transcriptional repressor [Lachnospiraceae bacterium]
MKKETKPACPVCSSGKTKVRSEEEYKDLIKRLNRIEGQIRGLKGMVENNAYCPDILIQVTAATSALNSFSRVLLSNHIRTCVTNDIKEGHEETVDELLATLRKMMK